MYVTTYLTSSTAIKFLVDSIQTSNIVSDIILSIIKLINVGLFARPII